MIEIKKIPDELEKFIDLYCKLNIKGSTVICPYFINPGGLLKKSVLAGKGTPQEIEEITNEMLSTHVFTENQNQLIRKEMEKLGIGIDCSGLVYQIYNKWLRDIEQRGELKNFLPKISSINPRKLLSRVLKPESSVSADMFTSEPISKKVEVKEVRPGNLIRTRGGKHLLFITEVHYKNSIPAKITFVNSTTYYQRNGIRFGEIILNESLDLANAEWNDNDPAEEVNYAYKGYRELMAGNGVFRPQFLK